MAPQRPSEHLDDDEHHGQHPVGAEAVHGMLPRAVTTKTEDAAQRLKGISETDDDESKPEA